MNILNTEGSNCESAEFLIDMGTNRMLMGDRNYVGFVRVCVCFRQNQNKAIADSRSEGKIQMFKGLEIYVSAGRIEERGVQSGS